jgi:hypothetical protein
MGGVNLIARDHTEGTLTGGTHRVPSPNAHHITETTPRVLTVSPRQTPITSQRPHRGYSQCLLAKRPSPPRDHTKGTHSVSSPNAHHIPETTTRVLTVSRRQTPITSQRPHQGYSQCTSPNAHYITHKMTWYSGKYYVSQFGVIYQFELVICRSWLLDVLLIPVCWAVRCGAVRCGAVRGGAVRGGALRCAAHCNSGRHVV